MSNQGTHATPEWDALYDAHVLFIKELAIVNQSYRISRVVGINTKSLRGPGMEFIRFAGLLGQRGFVTGIESLFERLNNGAGLCSVRGLMGLAAAVPLTNKQAHIRFVQKYGVNPSSDWQKDVENVLKKTEPIAKACLGLTSRVRNTRVAHLAQPLPGSSSAVLPSLDASEKIIELAYDFYLFISCGFLQSTGAELPDYAGESLLEMLKIRFELPQAKYDLPPEVI